MKPNPLIVIAIIFAASFAGRAVGIANAALSGADKEKTESAKQKTEDAAATPAETNAAKRPAAEAHVSDTHGADAPSDEPVNASQKAMVNNNLLGAIREREAALDKKAQDVEDRIRVLEVLEGHIDKKLAELKASNDELSKLVSYANEASEKDISMLAKMYEQMKPQKAGEIFDKMNPTFTAGFLTQMNSENAALILANMSTDKAYEASMIIASRNAAAKQ